MLIVAFAADNDEPLLARKPMRCVWRIGNEDEEHDRPKAAKRSDDQELVFP